MKKLFSLLLAAAMLLTLAACGTANTGGTVDEPKNNTAADTGHTRTIAEYLQTALDADLYEIVPQEPYTAADLDWMDKKSRSTVEMNDPKSRPAIAGKAANMAQYDTVFVGFPIWWYQAPRIIETFLESYDFSGKTIVSFCTSGGSGMGGEDILKAACSKETKWLPGKRLSSRESAVSVQKWVESLGL